MYLSHLSRTFFATKLRHPTGKFRTIMVGPSSIKKRVLLGLISEVR